ncbi:MAG: hypothetical protein QXV66_00460 [Candidatus Rehaiarchaeum fermentans]|nr:hypothetical protein [Candidatus Rehaiarchaeum fermentans]
MDQEDFINRAKDKFSSSITEEDEMYKILDIYDALIKSENLFFQSIKEFALLYFPSFAINATLNDFINLKIDELQKIKDYGKKTKDLTLFNSFLMLLNQIEESKKLCIKKIEEKCSNLFPNSSAIIEPLILARIMKEIGGSEKIPNLTISKLQAIGNPKNFYRKPSFGFIYNSKIVQSKKDKIKATRKLSESLLISLKVDFFRKTKDENLIKKLLNNISKIV